MYSYLKTLRVAKSPVIFLLGQIASVCAEKDALPKESDTAFVV